MVEHPSFAFSKGKQTGDAQSIRRELDVSHPTRERGGKAGCFNTQIVCWSTYWRNIAISNNVGGVKTFSSTLRRRLLVERHFALVEICQTNPLGSPLIVAGQELSPTQPSLRSQPRS